MAEVKSRPFDSDCAAGWCPSGCSHLMAHCGECTSEWGWGTPRTQLGQMIAEHVCPAPETKEQ